MHVAVRAGYTAERERLAVAAVLLLLMLPHMRPAAAQDPPVLPPIEAEPGEPERLSQQVFIELKGLRFTGNTAFTDEQLLDAPLTPAAQGPPATARPGDDRRVRDLLNTRISTDDLQLIRRALTLHYINHWYINSGVVLPDQSVDDGEVTFEIVEGRLTEIDTRGAESLAHDYLRSRLRLAAEPPLNIARVKDHLEIIRQNANFRRINAELKPGGLPGEGLLDVAVEMNDPFHLGLRVDNHRSPSIGAERISVVAQHTNLTGHADELNLSWGLNKNGFEDDIEFAGVDDIAVAYELPITPYDTTLGVAFSRSDTLVIEELFSDLDITSETHEASLTLRHPLWKTPNRELAVAVTGAYRRNETFLLGEPFSLSRGAEDGESKVTVIRFVQEYIERTQAHVVALRSTMSFGLDALGSSTGPDADSRFFTWQGQAQVVIRPWEDLQHQLVLKAGTQLSNQPLLSIEQFAVGGVHTVRGYRENRLVRDNGVAGGVEFRVPLLHDTTGRATLFVAPFIDVGTAWNEGEGDADIASAGLGVLFNPDEKLNVQVWWGHPFRDFDDAEHDLQDVGVHFSVTWMAF